MLYGAARSRIPSVPRCVVISCTAWLRSWVSAASVMVWLASGRGSIGYASWNNHSAHTSKQTRDWLATRPNRFKYVLTPTHGSWLNVVETLFGKMARTFLRQIRVQSKEELRERILKGIAEINEEPVVHRWKAFGALEPT